MKKIKIFFKFLRNKKSTTKRAEKNEILKTRRLPRPNEET
jgi:hypothetical protein